MVRHLSGLAQREKQDPFITLCFLIQKLYIFFLQKENGRSQFQASYNLDPNSFLSRR